MDWRIAVLPLVLSGCGIFVADSDDDGLSNRQERELQLDPENADTDGDGLLDGDEVDVYGTDPLDADSDGDGLVDGLEIEAGSDPFLEDTDDDGYTDFEEYDAGSDPADARDVVYKGGWPYYVGKDDIGNPNGGSDAEVGKRFRRMQMKDQFRDDFDLYDMYNEDGIYTILDISAEWCGPCHVMAEWLDGGNEVFAAYNDVREAVDRGDLQWVTFVAQSSNGSATRETVAAWADAYPHPRIPVLLDKDEEMVSYGGLQFWPFLFLLTPDMKLDTISNQTDSYTNVLIRGGVVGNK